MSGIEKVSGSDLEPADSTPKLPRQQAFETDGIKVVRAVMDGNESSGWHHHGDHHNYVYFAEGQARVEFGPDGKQVQEFEAGDFMYVPPNEIHRDINPSDERQVAILSLVGDGDWVVNVDGPANE